MLVELLGLHTQLGMELEELVARIEERISMLVEDLDIREGEYRQFMSDDEAPVSEQVEFEARRLKVPSLLTPYVGSLVQAYRLREVRVLTGFTRLIPPDEQARTATLSAHPTDWLPAIEIKGEGIFLALDKSRLEEWELKKAVQERVTYLKNRAEEHSRFQVSEITPRLILLHTLAHLMMAELSLECGYSLASLRERIYCSGTGMAGILIYTGSPDSEGTLGGLVRQGSPERISSVMSSMINRASWCANDPLCIEGTSSLSEALNLGACHACSLVPETSCEMFNRILDRGLVVGIPEQNGIGYFEGFQ